MRETIRRCGPLSLLVLLLLAGAEALAAGGDRVALVIGNSVYRNAPVLKNPKNDAPAIAAALRRIGFDKVTLQENLTNQSTRETLRVFARDAATAETAMIFFAGHGLEIGGQNYLVPTDAKLATDVDVAYEAVPLDLVLQAVAPAKSLRVVVLDACRDNPFVTTLSRSAGAKRSLGRGLGAIEPGGTLVAYAAKHGQQADDGSGKNSPFTQALLNHIATPALDIGFLFRKVRDDVLQATNGQQEPFSYGSLSGDAHYLVPPSAAAAPTALPDDVQRWVQIKASTDAADFAQFVQRWPTSFFAADAAARSAELQRTSPAGALPSTASRTHAPSQIAVAPAVTSAVIEPERPARDVEQSSTEGGGFIAWLRRNSRPASDLERDGGGGRQGGGPGGGGGGGGGGGR